MRAILPLGLLAVALFLNACASVKPRGAFSGASVPAAPDYSQDRYWAALPWTPDAADLTPNGLRDEQAEARIDVFFIHPTTYTGKRGDTGWNGPVDEAGLNTRTNDGTIQYQASLFNGVGRVFAPYYRQAHLNAYYNRDTASARQAFELAYRDVRAAFEYYLRHHNQGRPIIIASHSQGTTHSQRLMREFFDGKPLQRQLVAAYLVGIAVPKGQYASLQPCRDSTDTGCLMSWRTWRRGYLPPDPPLPPLVVTNPLSWTTSPDPAPASLNLGGVITPFATLRPGIAEAQIEGAVIWTRKPRFPGSILYTSKNFHPGDFNLYYLNVRENARLRSQMFLSRPAK